MSTNIDDIIRLFVRRQATAEQRRQVKEYIYMTMPTISTFY